MSYISILTPTYNRGNYLKRILSSLEHQSIHNFEWLIIDDGSTDNTSSIVQKLNSENFPINFIYKDNGGKHTALNLGIKNAKGDFILILDSDDYLTNDAIEIISKSITEIDESMAGVAFRRINNQGIIRGNSNFDTLITTPIDIRYKYKVTGDLVEVFKTDILKQFPFPEFEGEKFCPEVLVWNRIGKFYDIKYINKGIYVSEYVDGGLTDKIVQIRMNSPKASMITYSELAKNKIPFKEKLKANINFWRFSFNEKIWPLKKKISKVNPIFIPFTYPLGFIMYLRDKKLS